jgi:hypothetical protein
MISTLFQGILFAIIFAVYLIFAPWESHPFIVQFFLPFFVAPFVCCFIVNRATFRFDFKNFRCKDSVFRAISRIIIAFLVSLFGYIFIMTRTPGYHYGPFLSGLFGDKLGDIISTLLENLNLYVCMSAFQFVYSLVECFFVPTQNLSVFDRGQTEGQHPACAAGDAVLDVPNGRNRQKYVSRDDGQRESEMKTVLRKHGVKIVTAVVTVCALFIGLYSLVPVSLIPRQIAVIAVRETRITPGTDGGSEIIFDEIFTQPQEIQALYDILTGSQFRRKLFQPSTISYSYVVDELTVQIGRGWLSEGAEVETLDWIEVTVCDDNREMVNPRPYYDGAVTLSKFSEKKWWYNIVGGVERREKLHQALKDYVNAHR